jgi:hypothetical protein
MSGERLVKNKRMKANRKLVLFVKHIYSIAWTAGAQKYGVRAFGWHYWT